jgi:hypothetical protein
MGNHMRQFLLSASADRHDTHGTDDGGAQTAGPSARPGGDTFLCPATDSSQWRQTLLAVQLPDDPPTRQAETTDRLPLVADAARPTVVTTVTLLEVRMSERAAEESATG